MTDTSFDNGATVGLTDFSLTGFGDTGTRNIIDVPDLVNSPFNINGTNIVFGFTGGTDRGFTATFSSPINAFGATFNGVSFVAGRITRLVAGGNIVGNIPSVSDGSTGFYGFVANTSFTTLTFESANATTTDGFGADNFLYSSAATPVPFEFEPSAGLAVLGGMWLGQRWLKKVKSEPKI